MEVLHAKYDVANITRLAVAKAAMANLFFVDRNFLVVKPKHNKGGAAECRDRCVRRVLSTVQIFF